MARSPFTLVAAVTAALPGADVVGARALTSDGDGRFDSAVATLADGSELVIRAANDDDAARELGEESLALRALTAGAREMLPFLAPTHVGETHVAGARANVSDLLPGFQIDAADIPPGRGAATSIGAAIAAVHSLPESVVRAAGLIERDAAGVRHDVERLVDRAAATGRVPARLTVRWRNAVADDDLWRFETAVTLGGLQAQSFLFEDDPREGPRVTGMLGWRGLSVGDPADDLGWLSGVPEAADDVHTAYVAASSRAADAALRVRSRLHAELEFARWLVHGDELRRADIVDDAAALLESLAAGLRSDDLRVIGGYTGGVDSALDVLERVPQTAANAVDTSMQTDAYRPEDLWGVDEGDSGEDERATQADGEAGRSAAQPSEAAAAGTSPEQPRPSAASAASAATSWEEPTQDLSEITGSRGSGSVIRGSHTASPSPEQPHAEQTGAEQTGAEQPVPEQPGREQPEQPSDLDSANEAQRAARAALQRWTNSGSE